MDVTTVATSDSGSKVVASSLPTSSSSSSTTSSPSSDPDVDFLVGQWRLGYKKLVSFKVENFSPKNMYSAYRQMVQDRPNSGFKNYHRQTWVLHDPKTRMDCNDTCHALFMCAMVRFTRYTDGFRIIFSG